MTRVYVHQKRRPSIAKYAGIVTVAVLLIGVLTDGTVFVALTWTVAVVVSLLGLVVNIIVLFAAIEASVEAWFSAAEVRG